MNDIIKKISVGSWVAAVALLLDLIAVIIYGVNVNGVGYFAGVTAPGTVICAIFGIICLAIVIAKDLVEAKGILGRVLDVVAGVLKIVAVALPLIALLSIVSTRAEGLAFIYFSNEEVLAEVQTPANLTSASTAIASIVFFALAWIASLVGSFFGGRKA